MQNKAVTIENILGKRTMERYADIFPLLCLIFYDAYNRYPKTKSFDMLFNYDEEHIDLPDGMVRKLLTPLHRITLARRRKAAGKLEIKPAVMLSHTFVHNRRYRRTLDEIKQRCDIVHFLSDCDVRVAVSRKSGVEFCPCAYTVRPIFWQGSISGPRLKDCVISAEKLFLRLINEGASCDECADSAAVLDELKKEYILRIDTLTQVLKDYPITKYITINQYNLRDVMIITACRKLGIPTCQMEHHSSQCMYPADQALPIHRFAYTDSFFCWSESDLHFHKTFMQYQPVFDQNVRLCAVGNPEISYENALQQLKKYPVKNQMVYMISAIINENDPQLVSADLELQKRIFAALNTLKEKTQMEVLVRFPPAINPKMRALCTPIAQQYGFNISCGSLMEDMCTSKVMFGTLSSVMSTAVIMGRKVYRISDVKPLFTEKEISEVTVDGIADICDDWSAYPLPPEKKRFIDYDLLLK